MANVTIVGHSNRAVWGVGCDHLDKEIVGLNHYQTIYVFSRLSVLCFLGRNICNGLITRPKES
jgi:hypothetical protein